MPEKLHISKKDLRFPAGASVEALLHWGLPHGSLETLDCCIRAAEKTCWVYRHAVTYAQMLNVQFVTAIMNVHLDHMLYKRQ